jgi:hypothetical protein
MSWVSLKRTPRHCHKIIAVADRTKYYLDSRVLLSVSATKALISARTRASQSKLPGNGTRPVYMQQPGYPNGSQIVKRTLRSVPLFCKLRSACDTTISVAVLLKSSEPVDGFLKILVYTPFYWGLTHVWLLFINEWSYPCNRPWRPTGSWEVEAPTFSRQSSHSGEVVSLIRRPLFSARKIPGTHFC